MRVRNNGQKIELKSLVEFEISSKYNCDKKPERETDWNLLR